MHSRNFDYYRPVTVREAVGLLSQHEGAKLLAGGHSLLPSMKLRLTSPEALIDLGGIPGLSGIEVAGGEVRVGAMTPHGAVAASEDVRAACPILAEAAAQIGDLQVRNRGTIGGSLAQADPAADYPTVIVALNATLVAVGPEGEREIPARSFYTGLLTTALAPDEVLTQVRVPVMEAGRGGAYVHHRHPASSYAVVGVAALVRRENGACADATLAVGGATANPVVATAAEQALKGQPLDEEHWDMAAAKVREAITDPLGGVYATGEYRTHLAGILARRALALAAQRAAA